MALTLELTLNGTPLPRGRYVGWAPAPARLRVVDPDGAVDPIPVRLDSPVGRAGSGRVVFAPQRDAEAADQLTLNLPANGAPVDFWVLGRFQSPSRADGDAQIRVLPAVGATPLLTVPLMVRVRKDAQTLTIAERNRFLSALARLNSGGFGAYQSYRDMHTDDTNDEAHSRDAFLPWHRAYLLDLERELQAIDPSVTVPYWRFDQPAPRVFSRSFLGSTESAAGTVVFTASNPLSLFATDGQLGIVRLPFFDTRTQAAANFNGPVVAEAAGRPVPAALHPAPPAAGEQSARSGAHQLHRRLHQPDRHGGTRSPVLPAARQCRPALGEVAVVQQAV